MKTSNYLIAQVEIAQVNPVADCKPSFTDFIPATEWSVLAAVAVFLVRYVIKMNAKMLEEICEEEDN